MADRKRCRGCGDLFLAAEAYHRLCWPCWHAERGEPGVPPRDAHVSLDARTLRAAIALTHPDRHPPERGEQATRVTQVLTAALAEARELEAAAA